MDCEKFDQHVIDALYEELDELTAAALKRHTESCARCAQILAGLRSAREAATLPLVEPSSDLEARILAAEKVAVRRAPWYFKVMRGAAWAGSLAMRPQLAMAALFMLVVGSSLLLLRARPGTMGAPVQVTQRGEPGPAAEEQKQGAKGGDSRPAEPARAGAAAPARDDGYGRAERDKADKDMKLAERPDSNSDGQPPPPAPMATATAEAITAPEGATASGGSGAAGELANAQRLRSESGCGDAISRFDALAQKYPASDEAKVAKQAAADCKSELAKKPTPAKAAPPAASSSTK
jgi:hypothetical protein